MALDSFYYFTNIEIVSMYYTFGPYYLYFAPCRRYLGMPHIRKDAR